MTNQTSSVLTKDEFYQMLAGNLSLKDIMKAIIGRRVYFWSTRDPLVGRATGTVENVFVDHDKDLVLKVVYSRPNRPEQKIATEIRATDLAW